MLAEECKEVNAEGQMVKKDNCGASSGSTIPPDAHADSNAVCTCCHALAHVLDATIRPAHTSTQAFISCSLINVYPVQRKRCSVASHISHSSTRALPASFSPPLSLFLHKQPHTESCFHYLRGHYINLQSFPEHLS